MLVLAEKMNSSPMVGISNGCNMAERIWAMVFAIIIFKKMVF